MARLPRFFVPGVPFHVIHRGNNRQSIFVGPGDFLFFFRELDNASRKHGVLIHAYVLMTNHFHLLASAERRDSMPKMVQTLGRRYVPYFNRARGRTGTLWEGRYRATIVDSERYLFACMRYIELNPVRARLVRAPHQYDWSSFRANALGHDDSLVRCHQVYSSLGDTKSARLAAYREQFSSELPESEIRAIRDATHHGWALGDEHFRARIERETGRRTARALGGRPRRGEILV